MIGSNHYLLTMGHTTPWVKGYCSSCRHFWNPAKRNLSNGLWWIVLPLSTPLCNMYLLPVRKWSLFLFTPLESRWSCDLLSPIECCRSEIFKSYFKKICSFHFQSWNPDWSHLERKTIVNIIWREKPHGRESRCPSLTAAAKPLILNGATLVFQPQSNHLR